jgi:hypothetical protein
LRRDSEPSARPITGKGGRGVAFVPPGSSIRAIDQSDLSEEPDSLIKEPDFKIIYNFLIKDKGENLIK